MDPTEGLVEPLAGDSALDREWELGVVDDGAPGLGQVEVGLGIAAAQFAESRGVKMNLVALVLQTVRVDEGGPKHLGAQVAVRLVDLLLCVAPWSLLELPHLAADERDIAGVQFLSKAGDQGMKLLFIVLGEPGFGIGFALMPEDALQFPELQRVPGAFHCVVPGMALRGFVVGALGPGVDRRPSNGAGNQSHRDGWIRLRDLATECPSETDAHDSRLVEVQGRHCGLPRQVFAKGQHSRMRLLVLIGDLSATSHV